MDKVAGQKRAVQVLYPSIEPFDQRILSVGDRTSHLCGAMRQA